MMLTMPKSKLGNKVDLYFHILAHHWRQSGQEPETTSWYRDHEGVLLTGFLLMACSACFLTAHRATSPGVVPPTVGIALSEQSSIWRMPHSLSSLPKWLQIVLSWHKSSQHGYHCRKWSSRSVGDLSLSQENLILDPIQRWKKNDFSCHSQ